MKLTLTVDAVFDLSQALIIELFGRCEVCRLPVDALAQFAVRRELGRQSGREFCVGKDGTSFPVEVRGAVACARLFSPGRITHGCSRPEGRVN
jgi:hypothetical protein